MKWQLQNSGDISCLSNFEKHEIAEQYEYNRNVISILNGEKVISNGLCMSMSEEIRMDAEVAGIKSKILRSRGI